MKNIRLLSTFFLSAAFFSSCTVSKPTYLFKDISRDTIIKVFSETDSELKIQKNDRLNLSISSLNPLEDQLFNGNAGLAAPGAVASKSESGSSGSTLVSLDGNIYLHKLGTIQVAGLTRKELKQKLEYELLLYLKDPIVTVSFANHFITITGTVGSSQILNMPAEKISLIDAIALSGNISPDANLKNVTVIRDMPGAKQFVHLNLENQSIIKSPWYYLQPNDIVIINPNEDKLYGDAKRTRFQQILSITLSGVSLILLVLFRIIK